MSVIAASKNYDEYLIDRLEEYRAEHPGETWGNAAVAEWMIRKKYWEPQRRRLSKELARHLSKAENKKRVRNAQGLRVRVYHAATFDMPPGKDGRVRQMTFWGERLTMPASFAHNSFSQRWDQAAGICRSLHNEQLDFNDNNPNAKGHESELTFDFTFIVESAQQQIVQDVAPDIAKARRTANEQI